jgi:type II secretory pathway component PulM
MPALRPRERRLLVLAGLLGIGVAGYVYVAEPLIESHAATSELVVARRGLLARQQRLIARSESYGREIEGLRAEIVRHRARLLAGDKAPVAASELQKLVKSTAQESGIEVRSERILPTIDRGEILEVPIEITVSGEIRQLVDLLARLETAPKLLTIQELKLRVVNVSQPKEILATVTLSGYILTGRS